MINLQELGTSTRLDRKNRVKAWAAGIALVSLLAAPPAWADGDPLCEVLKSQIRVVTTPIRPPRLEEGETEMSVAFCSKAVVIEPRGPDGFEPPVWEEIDALANLSIVKEGYAWMARTHDSKEFLQQILRSEGTPPEIIERVWAKAGAEIEALIATGEFHLERTVIDVVGSGKPIPVYRMTGVTRRGGYPTSELRRRWCAPDTAVGKYRPPYFTFISEQSDKGIGFASKRQFGSVTELLTYGGRWYKRNILTPDVSIHEIVSSGDIPLVLSGIKPRCEFLASSLKRK